MPMDMEKIPPPRQIDCFLKGHVWLQFAFMQFKPHIQSYLYPYCTVPILNPSWQALEDMDQFMEKILVFKKGDEMYLGDEFVQLGQIHKSSVSQLKNMQIQYVESALSFPLVYLTQKDQGVKAGKDPEGLKKIITEQFLLIASTEGLEESHVEAHLLDAANKMRTWVTWKSDAHLLLRTKCWQVTSVSWAHGSWTRDSDRLMTMFGHQNTVLVAVAVAV